MSFYVHRHIINTLYISVNKGLPCKELAVGKVRSIFTANIAKGNKPKQVSIKGTFTIVNICNDSPVYEYRNCNGKWSVLKKINNKTILIINWDAIKIIDIVGVIDNSKGMCTRTFFCADWTRILCQNRV